MKKQFETFLAAIFGLLTFTSCSSLSKDVKAVQPFQAEKYLGKWYEIARLDFRYERGLNNTTAYYSMNKDGSIQVVNRGYEVAKNTWKQAVGKAKFVGRKDVAKLKVSFFGPFYGGYNVVALDKDYQYALIAGDDLRYLWILARDTYLPDSIRSTYLAQAKKMGFDVDALVWVVHDRN